MIHSSHKTTTRIFYRPKIVSYHPNENCSGNDFQSSRPKPARLPAILLNHFNGLFFAFHGVQTICISYLVKKKSSLPDKDPYEYGCCFFCVATRTSSLTRSNNRRTSCGGVCLIRFTNASRKGLLLVPVPSLASAPCLAA